ncbi:aldehyde dehydrogenase 3H1 [Plectosphaerella cucumerina]|uniref:Aldehyde dehydrogenase n=1 Tax=Plectosphaerella cucumerina TaxID=40658 RepID=A0A8K0TSW7_9PEZI|nr:aldehyde dehydrogenase 3H1 [Plectosphaerella cucumerina]
MVVDFKIPPFEHTSSEDIESAAQRLRATFRAGTTKPLEWRVVQLRKLYWALKDHTAVVQDALRLDLRKSRHEAALTEIDMVLAEIMYMLKNLTRFAADEAVADVPLTFALMKARIRKEPLGMVLIIGAYNFPIQLTLLPLVGAIAAGCTAVLKPSEGAPASAMALVKIIRAGLDPEAFAVVNGAVPETQQLLDIKWDKIFYTGGTVVGKIIAKKAAETLTPVCLELGGKNPAFVTAAADVNLAARRLSWGKTLNAGQVCLSHNYILVDRAAAPRLVQAFKDTMATFFPKGAKNSPDYGRIVNERQFQRIKRMLDSTNGDIVVGGEVDEEQLFIEPTIVQVSSPNDIVIREESFGPVFGILPYDTLDEAISIANQVDAAPLSLFVFGNDADAEKILSRVTSGGATVNDAFTHASIPVVPFGGIGDSGQGNYKGRASFDCFTHRRSLATVPSWLDGLLRVRYMPYSSTELGRLRAMNATTPDFDREGRQVRGLAYWFPFVAGFGAKSVKSLLFRWVLLFLTYAALKKRGYF